MTQIDPYIYPGTDVLINKFGFRNQNDLDKAESECDQLDAWRS